MAVKCAEEHARGDMEESKSMFRVLNFELLALNLTEHRGL
jgi:hypothetical protein